LYKNYLLLLSIVGIGLVNAANVILYTRNFTAFKNARMYACYCGVAPFSYRSGTSIHSPAKVSKMANVMLKADLSQAALSAACHDPELRVYYQRKLAEGKHKSAVLNAVKFKLIERMFAVVNRGSAYVKLSRYSSPVTNKAI
jgi:transposase